MRCWIHILVLVLTFLLATPQHLRADDEVVKLVTFEYPPLFHTSEKGPSGTVVETVKYMCERAKLRCSIEILPFKRAYQKIENKVVDAIITIKTDKFRTCCVPTHWETPWIAGLFSYKAQNEIPNRAEDMKGQRLIVVSGMRSPYSFLPDLDQWQQDRLLTLFRANDVFSATRMFMSKRAAYLWGSEDFHWYFDKQKGDKSFNFKPLVVKPIVVWFRQDRQDLSDKFNQIYAELQKEGRFAHNMVLEDPLMTKRYQGPLSASE